jgi:hypothetical protein
VVLAAPLIPASRSPALARWLSLAPLAVIAAGVGFVLWLQAPISSEVFFNGDGGVKFLLARQLAAGEARLDLSLPAPDWARDLWAQGMYPFHPPFVYARGDLHYAQYPVYFPLLTAPFYRFLGFRGLYVIPTISLLVFWLAFRSLCARVGMGTLAATVAMLALVFATPLTLYAAMFWEHTLAVALAFSGLATVLAPPAANGASPGAGRTRTVGAGILAGLSAWLRPEMGWFVLLLAGLALASPAGSERPWRRGLFAGSLVATALAALGANAILTGSPMGYYGYAAYRPGQKLALYPEAFAITGGNLLYYCPLVLVPIAYLVLTARHWKRALAWPVGGLLTLGALFTPVVSLLWPMGGGRQWGPRFLLIVVPVAALLAGLAVERMRALSPPPVRWLVLGVVAVTAALGFARNTVAGGDRVVRDTMSRVQPALEYVMKSDAPLVAVSRQWISQDLAAALDRRTFFLTPTFADLARLAAALAKRNVTGFVYLALPGEPAPPPLGLGGDGQDGRVVFSARRDLGQYAVYEARIIP